MLVRKLLIKYIIKDRSAFCWLFIYYGNEAQSYVKCSDFLTS